MEFKYSNVSLYNREELLDKLSIDNKFSNEDLLLQAYQIWEENLFDKINGDFAFALYDCSKDELFAARDPLGIKALYYVKVNEQYYFSDNINKLFKLSGIEKKPNLKSMYTLLYQSAVNYEETMYKNIKRIPPAHYLKITAGKENLVRYWYPEKIPTDYTISLEDASVKFNKLFEKAIVSRIGDDAETAYELSGGLDSSSIVSLVKTRYPDKKTDIYTMRFEGLACDEYPYIKWMEKKFDFHTSGINARAIDYRYKFNFDFNYLVGPHWPVTTTFTMYLPMVEKMQKNGKKIIITGQGGDHLLNGHYTVGLDLLKRSKFLKGLNELRYIHHAHGSDLYSLVLSLLSKKQKDFIKKTFSYFHKRKMIGNNEKILDLFQIMEIDSISKRSDIHFLLSASQSTMMDGNVFHVAETVYNVEFRHPFLDKDLVEFVLSLPPEYKYSKGWTKVLLRYSMKDILPEKIRSRIDKAEFSEVLTQQLNAIDIRKIMQESNLVSLELIEQTKIDKLIVAFDNNNYNELMFLWMVVNLEYWYQQHHFSNSEIEIVHL
jgi:asparagine synthase (glutamine-hydrolysing)